jgi:hypothetical protein
MHNHIFVDTTDIQSTQAKLNQETKLMKEEKKKKKKKTFPKIYIMADDSARQIVGSVGSICSCFFFWTSATLANDRLLNHLEKRYYNRNNNNGLSSSSPSKKANNVNENDGENGEGAGEGKKPPRSSSFRKRIEKLTNITNFSWTKDTRLLFYVLATVCSVTYMMFVLIMLITSFNPNSSLADVGSFFSIATYLSMVLMVFWTVLEGVQTVKRLGAMHGTIGRGGYGLPIPQNESGKTHHRNKSTRRSITSSKVGNKKQQQGGRQVIHSGGRYAANGDDYQSNGGAGAENDGTAFSMSHPTGSELQGDDEDYYNDDLDQHQQRQNNTQITEEKTMMMTIAQIKTKAFTKIVMVLSSKTEMMVLVVWLEEDIILITNNKEFLHIIINVTIKILFLQIVALACTEIPTLVKVLKNE